MLIPLLLIVTVVVGAVIYTELRSVILEGFDRKLSAISSVTGAFIAGEEHAAILRARSEESRLYRKYVEPMRRIRERKQLTFLYTQMLGKGSDLTYVLDGQVGDGHSAIGDEDTLPQAEVSGAREVLASGKVHLSEIRAWDQWGLLKSGFAPICDASGRAVAMAGADVDISTIRGKTGEALAHVGLTSVLALLAALVVALRVARSLTRPIAEVKEAALQVAAGQYGHRIAVERPRELAELANSFNAMSETLCLTVREWDEVHRDLEQRRRGQELMRALVARGGRRRVPADRVAAPASGRGDHGAGPPSRLGAVAGPPARLGAVATATGKATGKATGTATGWGRRPTGRLAATMPGPSSCSGSVDSVDGTRAIGWLGGTLADALDTTRRRAEIATIVLRLLERSGGNPAFVFARLQGLFTGDVSCFILLDRETRGVQSIARQSTPAVLHGPAGFSRQVDLAESPTLTLAPGGSIELGEIVLATAAEGGAG
jgi:HAMP domain-containing protein